MKNKGSLPHWSVRCAHAGRDSSPSPHWPALASLETQLDLETFLSGGPELEPLLRLAAVPQDFFRPSLLNSCRIFPINLQRRAAEQKQSEICHVCCVAGFGDLSPPLIHPSFKRALPAFFPISLVTTSFTQPSD